MEIDNVYLILSTVFGSVQLVAGNHAVERLEDMEMAFNLNMVDAKNLVQVIEGRVHKERRYWSVMPAPHLWWTGKTAVVPLELKGGLQKKTV